MGSVDLEKLLLVYTRPATSSANATIPKSSKPARLVNKPDGGVPPSVRYPLSGDTREIYLHHATAFIPDVRTLKSSWISGFGKCYLLLS